MCTVTIVPDDGRWPGQPRVRVVCNRDERRSRPRAEAAQIRDIGGVQAVYPVDPPSKGTWIAGNESGLIFSLLNRSVTDASANVKALPSRGGIIVGLLDAESIEEIADRSDRIASVGYAPFRLVVVGPAVLELIWDGVTMVDVWHDLSGPMLFTSSSLGDERVHEPRLRLFESMIGQGNWDQRWQDAFHQHLWPGQEEISVMMERADARTVSTTVVERFESAIDLFEGSSRGIHLPLKQWVRS